MHAKHGSESAAFEFSNSTSTDDAFPDLEEDLPQPSAQSPSGSSHLSNQPNIQSEELGLPDPITVDFVIPTGMFSTSHELYNLIIHECMHSR
jgi:hypothetical protein